MKSTDQHASLLPVEIKLDEAHADLRRWQRIAQERAAEIVRLRERVLLVARGELCPRCGDEQDGLA